MFHNFNGRRNYFGQYLLHKLKKKKYNYYSEVSNLS